MQKMASLQDSLEAKLASREQELKRWKQACDEQQRILLQQVSVWGGSYFFFFFFFFLLL